MNEPREHINPVAATVKWTFIAFAIGTAILAKECDRRRHLPAAIEPKPEALCQSNAIFVCEPHAILGGASNTALGTNSAIIISGGERNIAR